MSQDIRARASVRLLLVLLFGALFLTLSACSQGKLKNVAYEPANFGPPDTEEVEIARGESRIAPYDKLEIKVFQVEDLSGEFQVNSAGQISYPLIGAVSAVGKTPDELGTLIATQLGAKYLRSPKVQVNIQEAAPLERTVTVDGSVKEPGAFPVAGPITLMRAVALAKGLAEDANPKRVVIFRTVNGQKMAAGYDLTAIRRAESQDPVIYANDVVIVDGDSNRTMIKQILQTVPVLSIFRPF